MIPKLTRLDEIVLKGNERSSLPMLALMAISHNETTLMKIVGVVSIWVRVADGSRGSFSRNQIRVWVSRR